MPETKGEKRFFMYRDKIATRHDRNDKIWHTFLEYNTHRDERFTTIDFNKTTDRC